MSNSYKILCILIQFLTVADAHRSEIAVEN